MFTPLMVFSHMYDPRSPRSFSMIYGDVEGEGEVC